jgi:hypothetical protein
MLGMSLEEQERIKKELHERQESRRARY